MDRLQRREFITGGIAGVLGAGLLQKTLPHAAAASSPSLRKAIIDRDLPQHLPDAAKFALARRCGFDGLEVWAPKDGRTDLNAAAQRGKLARDAGVPVHSVIYGWWPPLPESDAGILSRSVQAMQDTLRYARAIGAEVVLLVPTRVTPRFGYAEAYRRSQHGLRALLSTAEETGVIIALENVWNRFLVSPLEFARYIDEFESPWIRAYFDVGNILIHGNPQDWIRILDKRLARIHVKDCLEVRNADVNKGYRFVNLLDGSLDWPTVRQALRDVRYEGWITAEVGGGSEAMLRDLAQRMDRIIAMSATTQAERTTP